MAYLKVTKRGTIFTPGEISKALGPGTVLDKDEAAAYFDKAEIDRLVSQGYLVRLHEQTNPQEVVAPPQTGDMPPLPHEIGEGDKSMDILGRGEAVALSDSTPPPVFSQWTLNPKKLKGKDVHELNIKIAELTAEGEEPFAADTVEEAIAWLSQDFAG